MRVASWSLVIAPTFSLTRSGFFSRYAAPRVSSSASVRTHSLDSDAGRVDHDDMGQLGQVTALVPGLGELRRVLRDQHLALGVGEDEGRLLGVRLRVHGRRRRARAHDAEVGEDPLDAGRGGERDALLRLHAQLDQTGRDRVDPVGRLRPAQGLPARPGPRPRRPAPGSGTPPRPAWPPRAPGRGPPRTADGSRSGSVCRSRHPPGPATVRVAG